MKLRDRIKELRRVPASQLRPNPKNWRTHPQAQADALRGVLAEIGIADAALARELSDGSLMLIDGHLRAETCGNELLPVLVLDVTEEEADKILLTLDPLAGMAGADAGRLEGLLNDVATESAAVQAMLDQIAATAGIGVHVGGEGEEQGSGGVDEVPEQFQVLIDCETEHQQAELLEKLTADGYKCRSLIS